jgi:hypothetical protein
MDEHGSACQSQAEGDESGGRRRQTALHSKRASKTHKDTNSHLGGVS